MSNEEARRIVSEGLEHRKEDRMTAKKEAALEQYEQDMIDACNTHCADARLNREAEQNRALERQRRIARRQEWAAQAARAQQLEDKSMAAIRYYGVLCLVVLLVSAVTRFPFWAAVTVILGSAVFPAAYIFRLYYPIKEEARCRQ